MRYSISLLLCVCVAGCGEAMMSFSKATPPIYHAAPYAGPWDVAKAADSNPVTDVVEVYLEAREDTVEYLPGKKERAWTYNGTVPGPLIEANEGDELIVHFKNRLPEATTIHWHGLRLPADMDGNEAMQKPVPAGGDFTYRFRVTDPGTFWYHPHVRSDVQVEKGLYGPIIVRGRVEPEADNDRVVMLDDVSVSTRGNLTGGWRSDYPMVGRQGNLLLANGKAHPVLDAPVRGLQRLRLVNASNARYFKIQFGGEEIIWLGSDAALFAAPKRVSSVLLVPGERADVILSPTTLGEIELVTLPYNRGHGVVGTAAIPVILVRSTAVAETDTFSWSVTPPATLVATGRQYQLSLEEKMSMNGMGAVFLINGESYPDVTPLKAPLGGAQEWIILNESTMDHPFHLHGFRFQVIGGAFDTVWKDTVNVPARSSVRLAISFAGYPGAWPFHCHILEHAERGMMGIVNVKN